VIYPMENHWMSVVDISPERPMEPRFPFRAPNAENISPKPNAMYLTWKSFKKMSPMKKNVVICETHI